MENIETMVIKKIGPSAEELEELDKKMGEMLKENDIIDVIEPLEEVDEEVVVEREIDSFESYHEYNRERYGDRLTSDEW